MSGEALPLSVVPAALRGAASAISGTATPLASPAAAGARSTEAAGIAGAAFKTALDAYETAFGQRLSTVAAGLTGAAGAYTGQDATAAQTIASVGPGQVV